MAGSSKTGAKYQLVIIGGGPAGLTAALYASRARLKTLLLEKGLTGGQITGADVVENFPAFPDGIGGMDLGELILKQATKFGLEVLDTEATAITQQRPEFVVRTAEKELRADCIIIAGGSERQKLNAPGEAKYLGKGVSYCATCDGALFDRADVAVIGGGNAALTEAMFLTTFAKSVAIIHRREELKATRILQERVQENPKIKLLLCTIVEEIAGNGSRVDRLRLRDLKTGEHSELSVQGVFINIGLRPNTDYLSGTVDLAPDGSIVVNDMMETNVPGIFAAGDIRRNSIKQAVAAAGDGAVAAVSVERYLHKLHL